jgi:hypothetical protein
MIFLAASCQSIFLGFTLIISFKTWFVVGIFRFLKWVDVDVLDFQIDPQFFVLFWLHFLNGHFLLNLLATLAPSEFYKLGQGILKGEVSLYH